MLVKKEQIQDQRNSHLRDKMSKTFAQQRTSSNQLRDKAKSRELEKEKFNSRLGRASEQKRRLDSEFVRSMERKEDQCAQRVSKAVQKRDSFYTARSRSRTESPTSESSFRFKQSQEQRVVADSGRRLQSCLKQLDFAQKTRLGLKEQFVARMKERNSTSNHREKSIGLREERQLVSLNQNILHRQKIDKVARTAHKDRMEQVSQLRLKTQQSQEQARRNKLQLSVQRSTQHMPSVDRLSAKQSRLSGEVERLSEFKCERQAVQTLHLERRRKLQQIHKELLVNDILIKQRKTEEVHEAKQRLVEAGRKKNHEI